MQWHWGNIGSALAGLSTLIIAAAAVRQGPAAVRAWLDLKRAQAEAAREQAETTRMERRRYLHGWSSHGVDTHAVTLITGKDELAEAAEALSGGGTTPYAVIKAPSESEGSSLRHMIESGGYVSRPPSAGEREALEKGLAAMGIKLAPYS